jgi:hypothetical protein
MQDGPASYNAVAGTGICQADYEALAVDLWRGVSNRAILPLTRQNAAPFANSFRFYTDSKAALKEAVMRPSERLSPWELLSTRVEDSRPMDLAAEIQQVTKSACKQAPEMGHARESVKADERRIER